jgi:hypothetical protein
VAGESEAPLVANKSQAAESSSVFKRDLKAASESTFFCVECQSVPGLWRIHDKRSTFIVSEPCHGHYYKYLMIPPENMLTDNNSVMIVTHRRQ